MKLIKGLLAALAVGGLVRRAARAYREHRAPTRSTRWQHPRRDRA